ncbi:KH domain-containing protein [Desmospora activa]|uniref:RNA-binding protein KhpA n=1 Tax=Desmospora activa DSM 45169 TaxID=1121389 RepID=A0A2T4ZB11_9BACL|nr:KH domain-containing protein [Desmospora activa]PTM59084.1 RNA-binding protein with KH domain [Desmospora activa DSM 45169]
MKELIEVIAKALVDHPEQVQVRERQQDKMIVYQLSVAPEDMGKVIGKQGRIAKALRTVVGAAAVKKEERVHVEIV